MEYLPNVSKSLVSEITNNYILKVNSRDRNILQEPNPFNFKIKFNKIDTKYTIYYEKGYWGSGNRFISNMGYPFTDKRDRNLIWNTSSDGVLSRTFYVNNGAIIEDSMEEVSDIRVTEIVAPRFVPDDEIGYVVNNLEAIARSGFSPDDSSGIYFRGIDNTQAKFHTYEEVDPNIPYVQITDSNQNKFFLFKETDYSGNRIDSNLQKNLNLFCNYYTDTLLLNNQIYKIDDISNGYLNLKKNNKGSGWNLDFLKSTVRFPKYYCDTIWSQKYGQTGAAAQYGNLDFQTNSITIADAEPMILVELVKDSIIEVESVYTISGSARTYSYFKISSVDFDIRFQQNIDDLNANFDKTNQTITITDLSEQAYNWISNLSRTGTTFDVSNCTDTTNQNNRNYTVFDIKKLNKTDVEIKTRGITNNSSGFKADFYFINQIRKKLPFLNLTEGESEEMSKFLSFNALDGDNKAIFCKVKINGSWVYNDNTNLETGTHSDDNHHIKFNHLKAGVKDLLNEKLFYLSLDPIVPSRNLITNNKLNNVIGVFYPSTQSKNYIFLTGQNKQKYNTNNLQNLNTLNFKLYYMNGKQVGENLKDYSLDYLQMDSKQTNITFTVEQVRKF